MTNIEKWLIDHGYKPVRGTSMYANGVSSIVFLDKTSKSWSWSYNYDKYDPDFVDELNAIENPFDEAKPECGGSSPTSATPFGILAVSVNHDKKLVAVKFSDGDLRIVHCSPEDQFDPEIGFCIAVTRHLFGSRTKVRSFLDTRATVIAKTEQKPKLDDGNKEK